MCPSVGRIMEIKDLSLVLIRHGAVVNEPLFYFPSSAFGISADWWILERMIHRKDLDTPYLQG